MWGANDIHTSVPLATITNNLISAANLLRSRGHKMLVCTLTSLLWETGYPITRSALNSAIVSLSSSFAGVVRYDLDQDMGADGSYLVSPDLWHTDQIHLTGDAYRLLSTRWLVPAINNLLATAAQSPAFVFTGNGSGLTNITGTSIVGDIASGGTATFSSLTATNLSLFTGTNRLVRYYNSGNGLEFGSETHIDWYSSSAGIGNLDVILWRSGVGSFGLKLAGTKASHTSPIKFTLENYFANGGVNREYAQLGFQSDVFTIGTYGVGDGVSEPIQLSAQGSVIYLNSLNFMPNTAIDLGRTDEAHRWSTIYGKSGNLFNLNVSTNITVGGVINGNGSGLTNLSATAFQTTNAPIVGGAIRWDGTNLYWSP